MEIEVGEYVRTKKGEIFKVKEENIYTVVTKFNNKEDVIGLGKNWYATNGREINKEDIKSHSKNIIDLIELKDYINGNQVIDFCIDKDNLNEKCGVVVLCDEYHQNNTKRIEIEDIKTIITKEQYEQNSYKIGG